MPDTSPHKPSSCIPISDATLRFLASPRRHLIGQRWIAGGGHRSIEVENPSRETTLAVITSASLADLDDAVAAARNALNTSWGRLHGRDRARILFRLADLLEEHTERIAQVMTLDNGIAALFPRSMVTRNTSPVEVFRYYAGWATKISQAKASRPICGSAAANSSTSWSPRCATPSASSAAIVPWNAPPGMMSLEDGAGPGRRLRAWC